MAEHIRTPIVCVLGHVDHGKTSLLDRIRGSKVVAGEAGAITQHIGATLIPFDSIAKMSGDLGKLKTNVPGLLFIDTPGHHAFTTLRARGGALADIAILVVDVNEGFKQQTIEALQILRNCKTPFVIAATKIDKIPGWRPTPNASFKTAYKNQTERVQTECENRVYQLVGKLSDMGFNSERFDRVSDFQRNLVIVPVSSMTGEGIGDLLMIMIGLAQRYLAEGLQTTITGPGVGTVLEVKEEKGLGTTLDVILYDGIISVGDEIGIAGSEGAVSTKVRALLQPRPMKEILVEDQFMRVKSVVAAAGVKISAPNLESIVAGSPIRVIRGDHDEVLAKIDEEMQEINITLSDVGVSVRADTIGALEALSNELNAKKIPIMRANVGPLSRRDLIDISVIKEDLFKAALCFNVPLLPDAEVMVRDGEVDVKIFSNRVIYKLIDEYLAWQDEMIRAKEAKQFETVVLPAKFSILPGCVFRMSGPAVVGVRVLGGILRPKVSVATREGKIVGEIKQIKLNKESVTEAKEGAEVAVSIDGVTIGRQIDIGETLYVAIPERHVKVLETEMLSHLNAGTVEALEEYTSIFRKTQPFWGK
ncbi:MULTISPECIES: translation initiation factor IF-2 [Methanocorpusculum]|jgi:translation initiation factor 5B|uniref:Probable translation initiation factor IF-2 n=1 Tax=Methanocorpusculum parvum TaxID=2193 RepID=A0AAX0Q8L1_9EURY|nr:MULTISPECIES: translation initiation factor IF-2 [Methanocorpusculum]MDD2249338.1 translation initiation factor IF-2 [Methanocorpusculum sp.]MDD2803797.1 translation initiation factor IF-2 [Methanocorpusculum sp.]MEA5086778.1 translation initiation factor IF-2 [Methanocorpusculum sp.]PAV09680.1 translation initiation factor IF-2 [Methanocorpusculum parvum]HJJ34415.1 translation initiation factor IF-2 [Methanocorpusculum sp.]